MRNLQHEILCVDDDQATRYVVRVALETAGFDVRTAESAEAALASLERHGLPSLAVVDIRMPGMGGFELCHRIHQFCDLPIILLTSTDDEETVVRALDEIAEDFIVKPFRTGELAARVRRVMHRMAGPGHRGRSLRIDDGLHLDFVSQVAEMGPKTVPLTPTEAKILHVLSRRIGQTVRRDYLVHRVWPRDEVFEDTLRVHMHRLRKKIEPKPDEPRYLFTERRVGYRLGQYAVS